MPDDLTTVLEWARKHGPADIENTACRLLDWLADATRIVNEALYGAESDEETQTRPHTTGETNQPPPNAQETPQ